MYSEEIDVVEEEQAVVEVVEVDVSEVTFPASEMAPDIPLDSVMVLSSNRHEHENTTGIATDLIPDEQSDTQEAQPTTDKEGHLHKLADDGVQLYVPAVPNGHFQDDDWSCGVQSTTRVLRAYGFDVSYSIQRSRVGFLPLSIKSNPSSGSGFSCEYSFSIGNHVVGMGRPPINLAAKLRGLGSPHWRHETQSNVARLKQLLKQNRPIVVLIRVNDVARADLCHDFGGIVGRQCLYSVIFPGLHYITLVGYNSNGFQYVDTGDNIIQTYSFSKFDQDWNFKGWNTGLVYETYSRIGAKPRSFLYYDQTLPRPSPDCSCDCCGCNGPCFCLVACGCSCKVPSSHFVRLKVENKCHKAVLFDAYIYGLAPSLYNSAFANSAYLGERQRQWSKSSKDLWWKINPGSTLWS